MILDFLCMPIRAQFMNKSIANYNKKYLVNAAVIKAIN